jgi:hypothetical protein
VPYDIADDQQGGILRPFGDQIKVAADLLGGGYERRGQLQAGALGQLRRGERIPDRTQILQLMLRRLKTLSQRRELLVAHLGFSAKAGNQRILAVLPLTQVAELGLPGVRLGVQPPEFCVLLVHTLKARSDQPHRVPLGIVSHRAPRVHAQPRGAQHHVARYELSFPFWVTDVRRAGRLAWLSGPRRIQQPQSMGTSLGPWRAPCRLPGDSLGAAS